MSRPLATSRHRAILRRLDEAEAASVEELASTLGVSRETIRRDLKHLAAGGRLAVVHGGALRRDASEAPLAERRAANRAGKEAIAEIAASLVEDGVTLLLDSGTSTEAVAEVLARSGRARLIVHTTSLANARILARLPGARLFLIGGEFDRDDDATAGPDACRAIARLSADLAFVGVGGVSEDGILTDYTRAAAAIRAAFLGAASRAYFLADRSKFGRSLPSRVPNQEAAIGLLVDAAPPAPLGKALARKGLRLIRP